MRIPLLTILIFAIFALAACMPASSPAETVTPAPTETASPSNIPAPTSSPNHFPPNVTSELTIKLEHQLGRGVIRNISVDPTGETLVVATTIGVWFYRLSDGEVLHFQEGNPVISIPYSEVADIVWSHDGNNLAVTQAQNGIWIWDAHTWELLTEKKGKLNWRDAGGTPGFAWSPDSTQLALGTGSNGIWIWDRTTNQWHKKESRLDQEIWHTGILWEKEGRLLILIQNVLYDVETGEFVRNMHTYIDGIGRVVWSPSQMHIYFLFDLGGGLIDTRTDEHFFGCCTRFSWSQDGSYLAAYSGGKDVIYVVDTSVNEVIREIPREDWVFASAWTPENDLLAVGYKDENLVLQGVDSGELLLEMKQHHHFYLVLNDENLEIFTRTNKSLQEWDAFSNEPINIIGDPTEDKISSLYNRAQDFDYEIDENDLLRISFSHKGYQEYEVHYDLDMFGQMSTGSDTYTKQRIEAIAISPDETIIAVGNADGDIIFWNTLTGALLGHVKAHTSYVANLIWNPFDGFLYSSGTEGTIKIWNILKGAQQN